MFNPNPRIQTIPITPQHSCYVIDDALLEPERWVDYAIAQRAHFEDSPRNAFPGPELPMPDDAITRIAEFFAAHARSPLGGRRTLRASARLSLTTRAPQDLQPRQWICHVDRLGLAPGQMIGASVLYLFDAPALGGTAFYAPLRPMAETGALMSDSIRMSPEQFTAAYGIVPGYMTASNAWFRKLQSIAARWNRMIFYPGTVLHSGEIAHPELLVDDPRSGRLAINSFFTCTRKLGA